MSPSERMTEQMLYQFLSAPESHPNYWKLKELSSKLFVRFWGYSYLEDGVGYSEEGVFWSFPKGEYLIKSEEFREFHEKSH